MYLQPCKNVLVVGDIMLDKEIHGHISKIAPEAPIPVFCKEHEVTKLGGAGNVAANLRAIGCERVFIFSTYGDDIAGRQIHDKLTEYGIDNHCVINKQPTIVKNRFYIHNKLLFRYDEEVPIGLINMDEFIASIKHIIETEDIGSIVFSDYNKGLMTHTLCQELIELAQKYSILTVVDPKVDYRKYVGCSIIKPNRSEVDTLFGVKVDEMNLDAVHDLIHEKVKCEYSVITLAEKGISMKHDTQTLHDKTISHYVIDVLGAGDVVNAVFGAFPHEDKKTIMRMANLLAGISIQNVGAYVLQPTDILYVRKEIIGSKLITIREFVNNGYQKVVFTNGCFDILHHGHLNLLEWCRSIGDVVIVGLNSDESIRRLKGSERPINDLKTRIHMLEANKNVDYVIVFDEDTPRDLLSKLKPNIMVKGGDYESVELPGAEYVDEVRIFPLCSGYSTTKIIEKIIMRN